MKIDAAILPHIHELAGIGYETAKFIAMMGAHVILACRNEGKAKDVRISYCHLSISIDQP